ncbi:MAG: transposase [Bacteroidota bacterium]
MSKPHNNRRRVENIRMLHWDYGWKGHYFITVNTNGRIPYFGEIRDAQMHLTDIGEILEQEWLASPGLRPDMNIQLGEFVIMPNHFHGIISIGRNRYNAFDDIDNDNLDVRTHCNASPQQEESTQQESSTQQAMTRQNKFGPQSKNLAAIIRGLKGSVTKQARQINPDFAWQSRFHEHVIRNQKAYDNISEYIRNNPIEWWNKKANRFNK